MRPAAMPLPSSDTATSLATTPARDEFIPASPLGIELADYLAAHPETRYVDVLLTDLNGIFRGKRVPVEALEGQDPTFYFPLSLFAMDFLGNVVEETGFGLDIGEPDRRCRPIPGTLSPSVNDPQKVAQLLLTMRDEHDRPCPLEPRNVLAGLLERLHRLGMRPVVAVELEFYLVDAAWDDQGQPQPPQVNEQGERDDQCQVYSVDDIDTFAAVLADIASAAEAQGLAAEGAVAEASPGQFEINLRHSDDVLKACDEALLLKRVIRQVAARHGLRATFMAKPYAQHSGSGMHVHLSLVDDQGRNLFATADGDDSEKLRQALAGMLALMPEAMALLAPNVNSYRRFQPGMYVPTRANWGYNNRTVALRIPSGGASARRIEHRVAGADANPYLAVAAVIAGLIHGIDANLTPPPPIDGNGLDAAGAPLPIRQFQALDLLERSTVLRELLGDTLIDTYQRCKRTELERFEREVTDLELSWMLRIA
ncbi:glutamine synthetase family protein [Halotalea alkalilenta]|uniref:glutamine synthetase family protein n=1 Tax=Halotalea alkalilenta TaxID=376489 RepID=UPI000ACC0B98|nr:glutamine synthetase family protein [Halotalea alkalilenta]